jgi:hypothetical protein
MRKKVLALSSVIFALFAAAEAQQPEKVFRIGFLDPSNASGSAVLVDVFRQELTKLGWIEGKTSPSSIGLPSKNLIAYLSLRRTWFVSRLI